MRSVGENSLALDNNHLCMRYPRTELVETSNSSRSFLFEPITGSEILKLIYCLDNSNSSGCDSVSNIALKKIALNLVDVLTHLFNLSVFEGTFPDKLKCAYVLPLFKKGNKKDKNNYRPISLLSSISKIFERAIKVRMLSYLKNMQFFNDAQFGFREGISTEEAVLAFTSSINKGLDDKKLCAGLFVDITKAFDMVDHDILIDKLYLAGFRGFILSWFSSYLTNRSQ